MNFLAVIGRVVFSFLRAAGRVGLFAINGIRHIFLPPFYPRELFRQMMNIGYYSLPVVGLTTLFTGAALAVNIYEGSSRFNAESTLPTIVVIGIVRELGPTLCGLIVAGRVSASMAAELGTMRVTEQIDALTTLSTDPFKYLIAPRILATVIMMPLMLVVVADTIGVLGGYLLATAKLGFNSGNYIKSTVDFLEAIDVMASLTKAAVFGFFISLMGCYHGFNTRGGAQGVGISTTNAVVSACIMILLSNYVVTEMFFSS
ncbi:MlaE family ABC transporter permease [Pseudemcibacter aquimaris]|uniref:MlaE family ABC transporter permease n=1 Tax=Pseudemcibacter aquimaris TaxID=2857064 RepID=UPI002011F0BF|nr:ABC transporter permease [Pseudemcibacter aquimaris]MCC3859986.1 ABC transporter permease [Pseudemcibacter aquimaris]WDU57317.1 ABC transporter permease [Pseudemcibacter aquimaris]